VPAARWALVVALAREIEAGFASGSALYPAGARR
jgi:hypothetical protein